MHWANGGDCYREAEEDFKALGLSPAQIDHMIGPRKKEALEIEQENWPAILVFCAMDTQWRYDNNGRLRGLDYPALESVMRMQHVKDRVDVFRRVRVIELEAMSEINRRLY